MAFLLRLMRGLNRIEMKMDTRRWLFNKTMKLLSVT